MSKLQHVPVFFQTVWTSVVRTFVPQIVGLIVALLAKANLEIDSTIVTLAVMEVFAVVYYLLIRGLEEFKDSKWGRFLGKAARPMYFEPHKES